MSELEDRRHEARRIVESSIEVLEPRITERPDVGIILGTGLSGLAEKIDVDEIVPYEELPAFPEPTVESHQGRLIFGRLGSVPVVAMQGRYHFYEGYSLQQIAAPVRVMSGLGADRLVVSNACGGMNPAYCRGDLMVIDDHINLLGGSPLIGPNDEQFGPRFPDMSEPYDREMLSAAERAARVFDLQLHRGVYVAVSGPNLETRAEYRFLRGIGADVVGMSTVPEVIAANHLGMRVFGISIITDECFPDSLAPVDISEILAAAAEAEPKMTAIVEQVVAATAATAE